MGWQCWLYMKSGANIFISEHNNQNQAKNKIEKGLKDGFFEVPVNSSIGRRIWMPVNGNDVHLAYAWDNPDPPPTQNDIEDAIAGLDVG